AGDYEVGVLASSAFFDSAYHIEIDGRDVTGQISVPNTGNWDAFHWVSAPAVSFTKGQHVLKVVADRQYFELDSIVIVASATSSAAPPPVPAPPTAAPPPPTAPPPPPVQTPAADFACTFNTLPDCGLEEQSKVPGRASITNIARDGGTALKLHTEP